jgi:hypothetical protein
VAQASADAAFGDFIAVRRGAGVACGMAVSLTGLN